MTSREPLDEITIDSDETLVYFDVKSSFTSIPMEEAIEQVETVLQQSHKILETLTTLNKNEIISLLKFCTNAANVKFFSRNAVLV